MMKKSKLLLYIFLKQILNIYKYLDLKKTFSIQWHNPYHLKWGEKEKPQPTKIINIRKY